MAACPICNRVVEPRAKNPSFPFCTPRCKTIDLGAWVNEEYRVPVEPDDAGFDGETLQERRESSESRDRGEGAAPESAPKSGPPGSEPVRH